MRRFTAMSMTALFAAAAFGGAASAGEKCFDKSTLAYVDCPSAEPAATERNGLYLGVRGGLVELDEVDFFNAGAQSAEYDQGYAIGGVIGFEFVEVSPGVDLRGETEIGYMSADVDSISGVAGSGDASAYYGFLNLYADLTPIKALPIDLILGAGVGYANVDLENHANPGAQVNDDSGAFAYHLDAGVGIDITESLAIEALYRYSSFFDAEFDGATGGRKESDVTSHQALGGLRYKF